LEINQDIDASARLISTSYVFSGLPTKTTTYSYGTLTDGSSNLSYSTSTVTTPYLTITNQVNVNGQIIKQTKPHPKQEVHQKVTDYTFYSDVTKPEYGLINTVDGPRT
jgi:hypothetical protein